MSFPIGPWFRAVLWCRLVLLPVTFPGVFATPPPPSARPGSHNRCRYRSSFSSPCPSLPSTTLPSPVPLIPNPTAALPASSLPSPQPRCARSTASPVSSSGPGSSMYSPSELDLSLSEAVATIGLHPSMLHRDIWKRLILHPTHTRFSCRGTHR